MCAASWSALALVGNVAWDNVLRAVPSTLMSAAQSHSHHHAAVDVNLLARCIDTRSASTALAQRQITRTDLAVKAVRAAVRVSPILASLRCLVLPGQTVAANKHRRMHTTDERIFAGAKLLL